MDYTYNRQSNRILIECNFENFKYFIQLTQITDKTIEYLIECEFKELKTYLDGTQIRQSIEYLIKCDFKQLQVLYLSDTDNIQAIEYLI